MIEIKNTTYQTVYSTQMFHFTGGLVAFKLPDGKYALAPIRSDGNITFYKFETLGQLREIAIVAGALLVGTNETFETNASPISTWRPINTSSNNGLNSAADMWGGISYNAHLNQDSDYQAIGRYISVSMQAVGIRLRDIALFHHDQLIWALEEGRPASIGFSNIPMLDLYLAFHSLATELCSARDHLAKLAAMHIQAKESVDNMPRLEEWLKKPVHKDHIKEPLVQLMMSAWGSTESPGFLRTLGDLRNKMIHRQPMSANPESAMLRTKETISEFGPIITIRLAPSRIGVLDIDSVPDPFETLLNLSHQMEQLATQAALISRYEPKIMSFIVQN